MTSWAHAEARGQGITSWLARTLADRDLSEDGIYR